MNDGHWKRVKNGVWVPKRVGEQNDATKAPHELRQSR